MPRTGHCQICGDEFIAVNKVRKYCVICQGIRDVEYAPKRSVECGVCKVRFYPLKANYAMCNDCREPSESPEKYTECKNCGRHLRPAPGLSAYCMSCVQSTQDFRMRWLRAVKKSRLVKIS